jgi:hypothetical protein
LRRRIHRKGGRWSWTYLAKLEGKKNQKKEGYAGKTAATTTPTVAVLVDMNLDVGGLAHRSRLTIRLAMGAGQINQDRI